MTNTMGMDSNIVISYTSCSLFIFVCPKSGIFIFVCPKSKLSSIVPLFKFII